MGIEVSTISLIRNSLRFDITIFLILRHLVDITRCDSFRFDLTDPTALPGYQEVPDNCPAWKKAMIEKKNKELEENAKVRGLRGKIHITCRGKKIFKFSLVPWASKVKCLLVLLPNNLSERYCQINLF